MAAGRLVKRLGDNGYPGAVTLICAEAAFGYNRVLLPDFVSGECTQEDLFSRDAINASLSLDLRCGTSVVQINVVEQWAQLDTGERLDYRQLIFATGSVVPAPAVPGIQTQNVIELRSIQDALKVKSLIRPGTSAVVLGGGLLGLEAGKALLQLGLDVCVVHRSTRLMNRQLDSDGADLLRIKLQNQGFHFELGQSISRINGQPSVTSITLEDGRDLPAEMLLIATGTQANDSLAKAAGIRCNGGICVNERLETNVPGVFALGECALINDVHYALVEPVFHQADVLAANLVGADLSCHFPVPCTRLKVSGVDVFSAGDVSDTEQSRDIRIVDADVYRRLLFKNEELRGAILIGDAVGSRNIHQTIGQTVSRSEDRERLAFGF